jgi:hypothetical protein
MGIQVGQQQEHWRVAEGQQQKEREEELSIEGVEDS